jgi:fructose-specific component phosphotransferase system IIB-like protein
MKTPEELAEEFAAINGRYDPLNANCRWGKNAFIGGYKAAQEHAHAALEEAEARHQEYVDKTEANFRVLEAKIAKLQAK